MLRLSLGLVAMLGAALASGADDRPKRKAPDAAFVPTPPDVVKQMLELAEVKKGDLVYDLGSGHGRIVIAAAKSHLLSATGSVSYLQPSWTEARDDAALRIPPLHVPLRRRPGHSSFPS